MSKYDLKKPCIDCPFRIGNGEKFRLSAVRISEIRRSDGGFACHKTVDYTDEDGNGKTTRKSQECAGFLTLNDRDGEWTQMMRIAGRLGMFNPDDLDPDGEVYANWRDATTAHKRTKKAVA